MKQTLASILTSITLLAVQTTCFAASKGKQEDSGFLVYGSEAEYEAAKKAGETKKTTANIREDWKKLKKGTSNFLKNPLAFIAKGVFNLTVGGAKKLAKKGYKKLTGLKCHAVCSASKCKKPNRAVKCLFNCGEQPNCFESAKNSGVWKEVDEGAGIPKSIILLQEVTDLGEIKGDK